MRVVILYDKLFRESCIEDIRRVAGGSRDQAKTFGLRTKPYKDLS